jgi:AraC-like DNA-binding protein
MARSQEIDWPTGLSSDLLPGFELHTAAQLEEIAPYINRVFDYPGTTKLVEPARREAGQWSLRAVNLSHMTLVALHMGSDVRVEVGPIPAYHISIALGGQVDCHFGNDVVPVGHGVASVHSPRESASLPHWSSSTELLCLRIRPSSMRRELGGIIGKSVASTITFNHHLDLTSPAGSSWLRCVQLLCAELSEADSLARLSRGHLDQLERLVMSSLLRAHMSEYSEAISDESAPSRWRMVKLAQEAIDDDPGRAWSLSGLASLTGVSGRRLQQGFHIQLGVSPMTYLSNTRLERVHLDLLADKGPVSEVATWWGFTHFGRFAGAYRKRFGELPSETLKRARAIIL